MLVVSIRSITDLDTRNKWLLHRFLRRGTQVSMGSVVLGIVFFGVMAIAMGLSAFGRNAQAESFLVIGGPIIALDIFAWLFVALYEERRSKRT